jgi:hypothetical protein
MRQVNVALPPGLATILESVVDPAKVPQRKPVACVALTGALPSGISNLQIRFVTPLLVVTFTLISPRRKVPKPPPVVGTKPPHSPSLVIDAAFAFCATAGGVVAIVMAKANVVIEINALMFPS